MSFISNAALNDLSNVYAQRVLLAEATTVDQLMKSRKVSAEVAQQLIAMDATPSKADSLQLAIFFHEIPGDDENKLNTLRHYYETFDGLRRRRQINAQINAFKTFAAFENEIDARASVRELSKTDEVSNKEPDYEDEYIKAWQAETPAEACELGKNYSFCISRAGASNMFYNYKGNIQYDTQPGDAATGTWFVRLKKRLNGDAVSDEKNDRGLWVQPEHLIVIHFAADGKMQWTWADNGMQGHGTADIDAASVVQQFPEFKPLFDKGILRAGSFSEKEIRVHRMIKKLESSADEFNAATAEQKEYYIKTYGKIPFELYTYAQLNAAQRNELFKRIESVSAELWKMMPAADKIRLAKMTMQPQLHARAPVKNTNLIYNILALDLQ